MTPYHISLDSPWQGLTRPLWHQTTSIWTLLGRVQQDLYDTRSCQLGLSLAGFNKTSITPYHISLDSPWQGLTRPLWLWYQVMSAWTLLGRVWQDLYDTRPHQSGLSLAGFNQTSMTPYHISLDSPWQGLTRPLWHQVMSAWTLLGRVWQDLYDTRPHQFGLSLEGFDKTSMTPDHISLDSTWQGLTKTYIASCHIQTHIIQPLPYSHMGIGAKSHSDWAYHRELLSIQTIAWLYDTPDSNGRSASHAVHV